MFATVNPLMLKICREFAMHQSFKFAKALAKQSAIFLLSSSAVKPQGPKLKHTHNQTHDFRFGIGVRWAQK